MSNSTATQGELAEILGVSQGMVSRYIAQGKIPQRCLVQDGRYTRIKVDCAVAELERNLDPTKRKSPAMDPDQETDVSWVQPYIDAITFDPADIQELSGRLRYSIDTISYLSESLKPGPQGAVDSALESIAELFGFRRVRVDGSPGKLCLPND